MKEELISVIKKLRTLDKKATDYINTVPLSLQSAVFDNDYTTAYGQMHDVLIEALFKDNAEDVFWFLHEFKPSKTKVQIVLGDGTSFIFKNDEQYYDYLRKYVYD